MRLFVAFDLGERAREHLERSVERAKLRAPRSKWVDPKNLHVTLVFLGSVDEARVADVARSMLEVAALHAPIRLALGPGGAFGAASRPNVLWASLVGDVEALGALQAGLAERLADVAPKEERPFVPHVTVARARDRGGDRDLAPCVNEIGGRSEDTFAVAEISLYQSETSPTGARYTRLGIAPLGPGSP